MKDGTAMENTASPVSLPRGCQVMVRIKTKHLSLLYYVTSYKINGCEFKND